MNCSPTFKKFVELYLEERAARGEAPAVDTFVGLQQIAVNQ